MLSKNYICQFRLFWERLIKSYSTTILVKRVFLKVKTGIVIFCCVPSKCRDQKWLKSLKKYCLFLVNYTTFYIHASGEAFCKVDFQKSCAKGLQTYLISVFWLFDSILWGGTVNWLGLFWKTDPRWLSFVPFPFSQNFVADLHAYIRNNPTITF